MLSSKISKLLKSSRDPEQSKTIICGVAGLQLCRAQSKFNHWIKACRRGSGHTGTLGMVGIRDVSVTSADLHTELVKSRSD